MTDKLLVVDKLKTYFRTAEGLAQAVDGISFDIDQDKCKEPVPTLPEPMLQASRVSAKETDYPAIREIHEAGTHVCSGAGKEMTH